MTTDRKAPADAGATKADPTETPPPAGPHATPELTEANRTPGAGTLPDPDGENAGDSASS